MLKLMIIVIDYLHIMKAHSFVNDIEFQIDYNNWKQF